LPIVDEPGQRHPAPQAVVQRLGRGRVARHLLALAHHPLVQGIQYRAAVLLAHLQLLWCRKGLDVPFDLIDPGELRQGKLGNLALVGHMQVEELASGVSQATGFGHTLAKAGLVPAAMWCTT
jgi:hypothetical protein